MPTTPHDAKGMLISAVEDDAPVILFEHRWLYNISGPVPEEVYRVPLDKASAVRPGRDVTLAATSYMTLESLKAAELLAELDIEAEVVDLRCLTPIDSDTLVESVARTGRLVVADTGQEQFGVAAEVMGAVTERAFDQLLAAPRRVGLPHIPTPTTPALADHFYPRASKIAQAALDVLGSPRMLPPQSGEPGQWHDVPDLSFTGPY